jgi:3-oxoadipate enol-lactonase
MEHGMWDFIAPFLKAAFVTCDLPGHAAAPPPQHGWSVAGFATALAAALDAEGLRDIAIGGVSIGGLIAQQLAADRPDLVSRLLLISTTHRYTDELRARWTTIAGLARNGSLHAISEQLLPIWFSQTMLATSNPVINYVRGRYASVDHEAFAQACEVLATTDLTALTNSIKAPTLVICGDEDLPMFQDAARRFDNVIPSCRTHFIRGARHGACLEHAESFANLAGAFIASAPQP